MSQFLDTSLKLIGDGFQEQVADKSVILLYPWSNFRAVYLARFIDLVGDGLLYYRIPDGSNTLTAWLSGMVEELGKTRAGFGKATSAALKSKSPAKWGEGLAEDLGAVKEKQVVLYVDELDRLPFDGNFEKFIDSLVGNLPANVKFSCNSRRLTHQPWYDLVKAGKALVLGTELRKDDVIFTIEDEVRPQIEVYAFGRGYAVVNGQQIGNWDGALPRNLFFFFMDNPLVTRNHIFQTFWPSLSVKDATNVFHVTKRKVSERITECIGGETDYELTQYSNGFYIPSDKLRRHYDVTDFTTGVERALVAADEKEQEHLLVQALEAYRGPFLQETEMEWVKKRRAELATLHGQALISLGRIYKRRDDDERAIGCFSRALSDTPEREDVHREVISMLIKQGRPAEAMQQFRSLEETLRKLYNIKPSKESLDLYKQVQKLL